MVTAYMNATSQTCGYYTSSLFPFLKENQTFSNDAKNATISLLPPFESFFKYKLRFLA